MKGENTPMERQRCLSCNAKLPTMHRDADNRLYTRSATLARWDKRGIFCTLRCAARWGLMAAEKAGPV